MKNHHPLISLILLSLSLVACSSSEQAGSVGSGKKPADVNPLDTLNWVHTRTPLPQSVAPAILGVSIKDPWLKPVVEEVVEKTDETMAGSRGFRIQIFSNSDRGLANKVLEEATLISGYKAYLTYQTPLYIIRIGNFTSESKAKTTVETLRERYPNATVVPEFIEKQ